MVSEEEIPTQVEDCRQVSSLNEISQGFTNNLSVSCSLLDCSIIKLFKLDSLSAVIRFELVLQKARSQSGPFE